MAVSSTTANPAATEVFFVRAMITLMSGGTTLRSACGSTTRRSVPTGPSPIARAASAWPMPTLLIPERTASQTNAEV